MIVMLDDEKIMRETKGFTKKYGMGTFYITDQRVCFESERDGLCFDLSLRWVFDWQATENSVIIGWRLPVEGRSSKPTDPIYKIEIVLECIKPAKNKLSTPEIIHYTLFYAYTNIGNCEGLTGYGWYVNEERNIAHRFCINHEPVDMEHDGEKMDDIRDKLEKKHIEIGTGDAKLDQLMFEANEMWGAWKKNGEYTYRKGHISRDDSKKSMEIEIPKTMDSGIETIRKIVGETEAKIAQLEKAGDTAELERIMPSDWTGKQGRFGIVAPKTSYRPTGTIYAQLEHEKKYLKSSIREKEIILGMKFDYYDQVEIYHIMLRNILLAKLYANENISTFTPEIEKIPDHIIAAKQRIEERRKKFNQWQT